MMKFFIVFVVLMALAAASPVPEEAALEEAELAKRVTPRCKKWIEGCCPESVWTSGCKADAGHGSGPRCKCPKGE